jgi:hypothetical protein
MQGFQQHNFHIKFGLHQLDDKADMERDTVGIAISEVYLFVFQQASSQKHWPVTMKGIRDFRYFRSYQPECVWLRREAAVTAAPVHVQSVKSLSKANGSKNVTWLPSWLDPCT